MGPEVNPDPQGEGGVEIPTGDHHQEGGLGDQGSRVLKVHLVAKVSMVSRGGRRVTLGMGPGVQQGPSK